MGVKLTTYQFQEESVCEGGVGGIKIMMKTVIMFTGNVNK